MNGYLQRLFDRAGAVSPAPSVAPAMLTRSPVVGFDQRMADRGMALDYGILGVSPESFEAFAHDAPLDRGAPFKSDSHPFEHSSHLPAPVAAPMPAHHSDPVPPQGNFSSPALQTTTSKGRQPIPLDWPAPLAVQSASPQTSPAPQFIQPEAQYGPQSMPDFEKVVRPQVADVRAIDLPEPSETVAPYAAPALRLPDPTDAPVAEVAPSVMDRLPNTPSVAVPVKSADIPIANTAPPLRPVPPPPPPPLAPPVTTGTTAADIIRLVQDATRAEVAKIRLPATAPEHEKNANPEVSQPGPHRPMTAQEASVIGALEAGSRPLTIYGVRRR